jgi:hypothetical protein
MQENVDKTYPMKVLTSKGWIVKPKAGSELPGYFMNELMADRAIALNRGKRAEYISNKKDK